MHIVAPAAVRVSVTEPTAQLLQPIVESELYCPAAQAVHVVAASPTV